MILNTGDKVEYVPAEAHALDRDQLGNYPWVIGRRNHRGDVEELTSKEVDEAMSFIRRHPSPQEERQKLVSVRPATTWPAVVRNYHVDDGTVDLDIQGIQSGVTLHYNRVPVMERASQKPHSCIPPGE
jgi:hypothetical protein